MSEIPDKVFTQFAIMALIGLITVCGLTVWGGYELVIFVMEHWK